MGAKAIGFLSPGGRAAIHEDYLPFVKSVDFIQYGFESEFVGRLPVVVSCHQLGVDDLYEILRHSEGSIIRQYTQAFEAYGIEIVFTDEGLHRLAEKAHQEQTGARSLVSVCERTFREFKYQLPHSPVRKLVVTPELVDSPEAVLEGILAEGNANEILVLESSARETAEKWSRRSGIEISLHPEAARLLAQKALDSGKKLDEVFSDTFRDYEHGFNLIKTRGINRFEITPDVVENPAGALENWIRAYYIQNPSEERR